MSDARPLTDRARQAMHGHKAPWSVASVAGAVAIAMTVITLLDVPKCGDLQRKAEAEKEHVRIEKKADANAEKLDDIQQTMTRGFQDVIRAIEKRKR